MESQGDIWFGSAAFWARAVRITPTCCGSPGIRKGLKETRPVHPPTARAGTSGGNEAGLGSFVPIAWRALRARTASPPQPPSARERAAQGQAGPQAPPVPEAIPVINLDGATERGLQGKVGHPAGAAGGNHRASGRYRPGAFRGQGRRPHCPGDRDSPRDGAGLQSLLEDHGCRGGRSPDQCPLHSECQHRDRKADTAQGHPLLPPGRGIHAGDPGHHRGLRGDLHGIPRAGPSPGASHGPDPRGGGTI